MLLKNIIREKTRFDDMQISGISKDSRTVKGGEIYFCLNEDRDLTQKRCKEALERGASVVVCSYSLPYENCITVKDIRESFAYACGNFYKRACDDLKIIGISGTNGKTTTAHIISHMLKHNGKNVGVIGTNGISYNGKIIETNMTTPDADVLHQTFLDMKNTGVEYVVMEVSAHAIDQKRIEGINFELGVLTNITQDHLDYFKTFATYARTKFSFFSRKHIKKAIVCVDDKNASKLLGKTNVPVKTYGIHNPCDSFAIDICSTMDGSRFVGNICDSVVNIKTNLIGEYNIYNSLAALTVCHELGFNDKELEIGLNFIEPAEGRFNVVNFSGRYVIIDYAHTPDGLLNILKTARALTDKKVYVIFGCGGNRDKDKRAKMGKIAEEYADYVCLTDDNPRNEKSYDIIMDIERGMKKPHFIQTDRKRAISRMIDLAQKDDIIIIAGKGAEKYQEIGDKKYPYNDFDAVYGHFKELDPCSFKGDGEKYVY
ncbi:MAG: UDP-N-acetylmuramoyl-L-alanyl-D-glutamate--2,6-diaminopimelate ligase [Clostridia bacterium]|nr:UDP-N-acetylmuramoyl-L-alanyl-D-glutamate--2,6-diaminopimelate ligase [Clostridia bacterium]